MKILYNNISLISIPSKIILYNSNNSYFKFNLTRKLKYYDKLFAYDYLNNLNKNKINNIKIVFNDNCGVSDYIYKYNLEKDEYDENTYHLYKGVNAKISKPFNIGWFIGNLYTLEDLK